MLVFLCYGVLFTLTEQRWPALVLKPVAQLKVSNAQPMWASLLVIREKESFVVSAAATRWIGNLCYTVVSLFILILPLE